MKVLLTGGAGYVGSHTAVALVEAGHDVVLYDNFSNSQPVVLQRLEAVVGRALRTVRGDVRDTELLSSTMHECKISAVMHFAGLKAVGESVALPVNYYANNVQGTISLLRAMTDVGIKHLIFSSSATVYGVPQYLPLDENHPISATNPYGRTKVQVEEMLADLVRSDPEWRVICLRYFNPVGSHASGLIGDDPNGTPNNLMPFIVRVAAGQLDRLSIFGGDYDTADGTGVRDYIHVVDAADGHVKALNYLVNAVGCEAVNLGTGRGYSVLELVKSFAASSGRDIPFEIVARRPGDVASSYAWADKARQLFDWSPSRSLDEMCQSAWTHHVILSQQKLGSQK